MFLDSHRATTIAQYRASINEWTAWCTKNDKVDLPYDDEDLIKCLSELADAGRSAPSLRNFVAALNCFCVSNGFERRTSAKLRTFLRVRNRKHQRYPVRPFYPDDIKAMCDLARFLYPPLRAARDVAMFIHFFASAERASELCALRVEHVVLLDTHKMIVRIPRSKGDPEGHGQHVAIRASRDPKYCPVTTMRTWLQLSGLTSGPVFQPIDKYGRLGSGGLHTSNVYRLVREYATQIGLGDHYGTHSFRRGNATAQDALGCDIEEIRTHLRHEHRDTTELYIEHDINWQRNVTGVLLR